MRRRPEGGRLVILHAGTKDGFIPGIKKSVIIHCGEF